MPDYTGRAPWFGLIQFHREHDPDGDWIAPAISHLGFAVRDHEEDTCADDPETELTDAQIEHDIQSAYDRGFVIIHYGGAHDAAIQAIYSRPPLHWSPQP